MAANTTRVEGQAMGLRSAPGCPAPIRRNADYARLVLGWRGRSGGYSRSVYRIASGNRQPWSTFLRSLSR